MSGRDKGAQRCPRHNRLPVLAAQSFIPGERDPGCITTFQSPHSQLSVLDAAITECPLQAALRDLKLGKWDSIGAGSMSSDIRQTWVPSHFINSSKVILDESPHLSELSHLKMRSMGTCWGRITKLNVSY